MKTAVVISASSDIGAALTQDWLQKGWNVIGTYKRSLPSQLEAPIYCDLFDKASVQSAIQAIQGRISNWDVLLFAPGTLNPIGRFQEVNFDEWEKGVGVNLLNPLNILHGLLPHRSQKDPCVLFFGGAGTNGPAPHYSCYALSKIALIKMCELLDAEMPDTKFAIVGPGWVKTKIHEETLEAGEKAGPNFQKTFDKLENGEFTPMEEIIDCCNWIISTPSKAVSGRNYSVAYDRWGTPELEALISQNADLYKLRREGNNAL